MHQLEHNLIYGLLHRKLLTQLEARVLFLVTKMRGVWRIAAPFAYFYGIIILAAYPAKAAESAG
ncbi:hypothetical protein SOASR030_16170 [Leminorella grimontii]|uniref:Uncharacterized protein n=1 Tax=Leminorella grimontii TaxID=82981 RepID=A0AAV5N1U6_9GAMM|nr:hypothetical protein SOASR030_16170 [Leminorella grimontii]GKX59315.1 hypothetical protein SOASR031_16300 [Leminorella grimontii]